MLKLNNTLRIVGHVSLALSILAVSACNNGALNGVKSTPALVEALFSTSSIIADYNKARESNGFQSAINNFSNITWASLGKAKPSHAIKIDDFDLSSLGAGAGAATEAFEHMAAQDRTLGKSFAAAGWTDGMAISLSDLQGAVKVLKGAVDRTTPFHKNEQLLVAKLFMASLATKAKKAGAGLALDSGYIGDRGNGWSEVSAPDFGDGLLCFASLGFSCNKHGSKVVRTSSISCNADRSYGLWGWAGDGCPDATTGGRASGTGGAPGSAMASGTGGSSTSSTKYNADGYNDQGYNDKGCNRDGYLASGESCHPGQ